MNRDELDNLKAKVDLVELIRSSGVPLKKVGKNWTACCPFHEDREASFVVNPQTGLFNCFGCQTGGDAFRFLQLKENLAFPEAVERVRSFAGDRPAPERAPAPLREETLPGGHTRPGLLDQVVAHYARRLTECPPALEYLAGRGLGGRELREAFRLGYADGSLLETAGDPELRQALTRIGVLTEKGQELLAGCVVVPLEHPDQGVVGLYGRKISPWARVKHLYLPGPKRGVFHWQALRESPELVLAESVLDALSFWVAGVRHVSCLYGVQGLPVDLEAALTRYGTQRVLLCLDDDPAGRQAASRLRAELTRRGLEVVELTLGEGRDPNQVLLAEGPQALAQLLNDLRAGGPGWESPPRTERAEPHATLEQPVSEIAPARPTSLRPERHDTLESPPLKNVLAAWKREDSGDGFLLHFGGVQYRVTMRPPFTGKLRVTLRVSAGDDAHIDTLDLYSHRARVTAVKQVSYRLGLDSDTVEQQFSVLLGQAEAWAAEAVEREADDLAAGPKKRREMTPAEKEEALEFLRRPDLAEAIRADMEALGYIGEERGKLLAYLIGISRRLERPLSGTIISQSGAGKSGMAELVETLTPIEDVVLYSRLSPQALVYVPRDFLKRKLLIIEERKGAEDAEYSIRVLQSKQRLSSAIVVKDPNTGKMKTQVFDVEGPVAYLETTTNPRAINHENATRCFEIWLDESEEQTRRIHQRQRAARSAPGLLRQTRSEGILRRHHNAQRLLLGVRVLIPYAQALSFPARWLRTRRDHERFLCLVEAVAFLYQYQRVRRTLHEEGQEVVCIEATAADYRLAYELAQEVLCSTFHELTRAARDLWQVIRELAGPSPRPFEFTRRELRHHSNWLDHRLRDALQELVDMEYLAVVSGGTQGKTYTYRLLVTREEGAGLLHELTTPDQLEAWLRDGQADLSQAG